MRRSRSRAPGIGLGLVVVIAAVSAPWWWPAADAPAPDAGRRAGVHNVGTQGRLLGWWPDVPASLRTTLKPTAHTSNIHPADYAGPESCKRCHQENYESWSKHPHRWMNAVAWPDTVVGDFSGRASAVYLGGRARFYQPPGPTGFDGKSVAPPAFRMQLDRDGITRRYRITQTIGSRFYQYYVGLLEEGPEPPGHRFRTIDHVLPFGYWIDRKQWVPVVHVHRERPELDRADPYAAAGELQRFAPYAKGCNGCHTTFPLGDMFTREAARLAKHAPLEMHWSLGGYLRDVRRDVIGDRPVDRFDDDDVERLVERLAALDARDYGVTLGISCEACHLGASRHAANPDELPEFFPASPHLLVNPAAGPVDRGRTHQNLNWACGRCHAGSRSEFAAGMGTWNSIEYTDATLGGCYTELKCIDCHDPHQAIGRRWTRPPLQDDRVCLKCHERYREPQVLLQHTHHRAGSAGSHCLDCHMPRINEGLQDVVRTHMITSPTRADMIHANHPNACNLCHPDRPIDWTLKHLQEWYGAEYDADRLAGAYARRAGPAGVGWLHSDSEAVRLVAADALVRTRSGWAVEELLGALDDEFLLNRQFAMQGLEDLLGVRLADFGYRFSMTREERGVVLGRLRAALVPAAGSGP